MKKTLALTMRVDINANYHETRDALDQRLVSLAEGLGFTVILIPNVLENVKDFLSKISPSGVILSGGNDIDPALYGGNKTLAKNIARKRDKTECDVINYAVKKEIPVMGICRGMQMINVFFGGSLTQDVMASTGQAVSHVASKHTICFTENMFIRRLRNKKVSVNSYHSQGVTDQSLAKGLVPVAYAPDMTIEALMSRKHRIWGIQWHPERSGSNSIMDKTLIKKFFA